MNEITLTNKEYIKPFIHLSMEDDRYQFYRDAKIPRDILNEDVNYSFLPESVLKNLIHIAGEKLTLNEFVEFSKNICTASYIKSFAPTLDRTVTANVFLEEFSHKLKKINSGASVILEREGNKWWLTRKKAGKTKAWFKHAELFSIVFMFELMKLVTADRWAPSIVGVCSLDIEELEKLDYFNGVQFCVERSVTAIEIPQHVLNMSIAFSGEHELLNPIPDNMENDFVGSFKIALLPYLHSGKLPMTIASEIIQIKKRTLQRRFENENIIYRQVIENMVFEKILKLVEHSNMSMTDISSMMGYSSASHFTRAFKRQTGMTPFKYRKQFK